MRPYNLHRLLNHAFGEGASVAPGYGAVMVSEANGSPEAATADTAAKRQTNRDAHAKALRRQLRKLCEAKYGKKTTPEYVTLLTADIAKLNLAKPVGNQSVRRALLGQSRGSDNTIEALAMVFEKEPDDFRAKVRGAGLPRESIRGHAVQQSIPLMKRATRMSRQEVANLAYDLAAKPVDRAMTGLLLLMYQDG